MLAALSGVADCASDFLSDSMKEAMLKSDKARDAIRAATIEFCDPRDPSCE
jgi:hypothetical protein